jgi:hypothetical protein
MHLIVLVTLELHVGRKPIEQNLADPELVYKQRALERPGTGV